MSILQFSNLGQAYGGFDVFMGLDGKIESDSKIGLVGRNGIGKTTLLQVLAGLAQAHAGKVTLRPSLRIGYLRQEAVLAFADRENTLHQEMLTVFERIFVMQAQMTEIEHKMADMTASDEEYGLYSDLAEQVEFYGGYDYERRIERTLEGLGFTEDDWGKALNILSGGQKTRALLAKLILESPDLLILDEPTNHLDIQAIRWLEGVLHLWKGALLIVSHDRYFLDRVINRVWEMNFFGLDEYRGNYSAYMNQREAQRERTQIEWDAMMERFHHQYGIIKTRGLADPNAKGRFRILSREVEAVQSNGIAAMRFMKSKGWAQYTNNFERKNIPQTVEQLDRALKSLQSPIRKEKSMKLALQAQERSGDNVLRGRHLSIGYERDKPLFTADDIDLQRGDVVALIGANGTGKSTLLKTLLGKLEAVKGHFTFGVGLQIGYFAQAHDELDHTKTVVEELMRHKDNMKLNEARQHLGAYLFSGDDAFKPVSTLSGGERGRLSLAILALKGANLMLLDEPTNHLDIPSQEILQEVLEAYTGTIILVTHDRYLVDQLASQIWDLSMGHLRVFKGTYQEYLETLEEERSKVESQAMSQAVTKGKAQAAQTPVNNKELAKLERQINSLESEISELENLLEHASKAGNGETIVQLSQQYSTQQKRLQELLVDWEDVVTEPA